MFIICCINAFYYCIYKIHKFFTQHRKIYKLLKIVTQSTAEALGLHSVITWGYTIMVLHRGISLWCYRGIPSVVLQSEVYLWCYRLKFLTQNNFLLCINAFYYCIYKNTSFLHNIEKLLNKVFTCGDT